MSVLKIRLVDTLNDRRLSVNLPADAPVDELAPALARKLDLPEGDYTLTIEGQFQSLDGAITLAQAGLAEGATLRLARAPAPPREVPRERAAPPVPPASPPLSPPPAAQETRSAKNPLDFVRSKMADGHPWGAALFLALGWVLAALIAWGIPRLFGAAIGCMEGLQEGCWDRLLSFSGGLGLLGGILVGIGLKWRLKTVRFGQLVVIVLAWVVAGVQLSFFRCMVNSIRLIQFGVIGGLATALVLKWPLPSLSGQRALGIFLGWVGGWSLIALLVYLFESEWYIDGLEFFFPILLVGTWVGNGIMLGQVSKAREG